MLRRQDGGERQRPASSRSRGRRGLRLSGFQCSASVSPLAFSVWSLLLSRLGQLPLAFASRGFHFLQKLVEVAKTGLPKPAVGLQPLCSLGERLRFDPRGASLSVTSPRDQPRALEHLQVLGDRRL